MQSVDLHVERHLPSRGRSHRTVATVTCVTALGDIRSAQLSATGAWPAVLFPSWSWLCGIGGGVDLQKPSCRAKVGTATIADGEGQCCGRDERAVRTDIHVAVGHRRQRPGVACASGLRKNMEPAGLASLLGLVVWLVSASGFG